MASPKIVETPTARQRLANGSPTARVESSVAAFNASRDLSVVTRSSTEVPDQLYNLEIRQYDQSGNHLAGKDYSSTSQGIGTKLDVALRQSNDCQLVVVARGSSGAVSSLGTKTLTEVQAMSVSSSVINAINPSVAGNMNAMPYVLHLEHVKVTNDGKLQSIDGAHDARLLLKRLAAKLTVNWNINPSMNSYTLKEVKLCQVPSTFRIIPSKTTTEWGTTYPSEVSEFIESYRLTNVSDLNANTKTVWIPANVRGTSARATSPYYRTKDNAPTAASYTELVLDNAARKERLYYRAYLGGVESTDFNLYENCDYNWTLTINSANYQTDRRIQLLDQTPVRSSNLVSTSNCFMMQPGTDICFNPYKHEAGINGWNTNLTDGTTLNKTIASVKVLWQTKDAGTSGDLVMGYVIDDVHHENLVNVSDIGNKDNALVHVKVPVTKGGNAVIAAYAADGTTILWSWHVWVSDYIPVGLKGTIDSSTRAAAITTAQAATQGGTVHAYSGTSWVNPTGAFYKKVIMDRHLGATANTYSTTSAMEASRAYGMLYQWGRKDPLPGSLDGTASEIGVLFDGYGVSKQLRKESSSTLDYAMQNPDAFCKSLYLDGTSWGGGVGVPKTIYDPCPNGWRVPDFNRNSTHHLLEGFSLSVGGTVRVLVAGVWMNTTFTLSQSTFDVSNGFLYKENVWLPIVRMRETGSGDLRDPWRSGRFDAGLVPSFCLWGASAAGTKGWYYECKSRMPEEVNHFPTETVASKPYGFSVRCVQE